MSKSRDSGTNKSSDPTKDANGDVRRQLV
jgi:hypothetical protein